MNKTEILTYLENENKGVTPEEMAQALGCTEKYPVLIGCIAELEREGQVVFGRRGRVLSARTAGVLPARIVSVSRNFAFARPETGEDVYLSKHHLGGATLRDRVLLSMLPDRGNGIAGRVERVLETGSREFTGTVVRFGGAYEITADDSIRFGLPVEKKKLGGAKVGDKVLFTLRFDKRAGAWYAAIKKVYGRADSARVCADAILDAQGIPSVFSGDVIAEGKHMAARGVTEEELRGRLDLRGETIFTIDGSDAKDLDDAISVTRTDNGYALGVHIADVSHYVKADSPLDKEAFLRGTSVYFADRVIPMLPQSLSGGICSLNAGEDKLTFSCLMELDGTGKIKSYEFRKSVIHSNVRGVYSEINALYEGTADRETEQKYSAVREALEAGRTLFEKLKARAMRRGTMNLDSRESQFILDENGMCVDILPRERGTAEEMIEHFMISANGCAAELARTAELPFVHRVHEDPPPDKLVTLAALGRALGFDTRRLGAGVRSGDFSKLLETARPTKYGRIISTQLLRTMAKARYAPDPIGHFGLSLHNYCHFTSPIRRYPDLAIHRILTAFLEGEGAGKLQKRLGGFTEEAAKQSSVCELRAMTGERLTEDVYTAEYMRAHIGEEYDAVICGVTRRGLFVELVNSVEGFVSVDNFPKGRYEFDELTAFTDRTTGRQLCIGGEVRVQCVSADVYTARVDFIILE